jgi:hypothetical protein
MPNKMIWSASSNSRALAHQIIQKTLIFAKEKKKKKKEGKYKVKNRNISGIHTL